VNIKNYTVSKETSRADQLLKLYAKDGSSNHQILTHELTAQAFLLDELNSN
jgi:hypothetical protein